MDLVERYSALNRPKHPECSVCIANYNGAALLDECISSVLSQVGGVSFEIIVHDDGSTDDSVALLLAKYPEVEILVSRSNVGFCVANNRMAKHALGDFLVLLNNDATLLPDALAAMVDQSKASSTPCIITLPQYDWATKTLVDRGCLLDFFYNPVPNLDSSRSDVAMVIGACLFLSRDLWLHLGGFPNWMGSIAEDMYLCCLARLFGLKVYVTKTSGYMHRQGISFGGGRINAGKLNSTFIRRKLSERNKTSVMILCTPSLWVWPLLATHLLMLSAEGLLLMLLKWNWQIWTKIYWPTFGHVVNEFSQLRSRREDIQRRRKASIFEYMRGFVIIPRKITMLFRYGLPTLKNVRKD